MQRDQSIPGKLLVCIPTFKRAELAGCLLADLNQQSVRPHSLVLVDGDPASGEVWEEAKEWQAGLDFPLVYLPSNHANLPYQRYLGWRWASARDAEVLLYLDDDLRIHDCQSVQRLVSPLRCGAGNVAGCTGTIRFGKPRDAETQTARDCGQKAPRSLVRWLGSSRRLPPGSLAASGHRCGVKAATGEKIPVQWLWGPVMAYRLNALDEECFSRDLFAMYERRCGRGEDTLLSHRVASKGSLLMVCDAMFEHPHLDAPQAYPRSPFRLGQANAYSRCLLNNNYRWPGKPRVGDRLALWKSYAGMALLNFLRSLRSPGAARLAYASGYFLGAVRGLCLPPTQERLTPRIEWQTEAVTALRQAVELRASP